MNKKIVKLGFPDLPPPSLLNLEAVDYLTPKALRERYRNDAGRVYFGAAQFIALLEHIQREGNADSLSVHPFGQVRDILFCGVSLREAGLAAIISAKVDDDECKTVVLNLYFENAAPLNFDGDAPQSNAGYDDNVLMLYVLKENKIKDGEILLMRKESSEAKLATEQHVITFQHEHLSVGVDGSFSILPTIPEHKHVDTIAQTWPQSTVL